MSTSNPRTVLVIGDWFIDEYWFISQHHSDVSSHRGPIHYRIVSEPTHAVRDLCGAGLTARVLYELRKYHLTDNIIDDIIERLKKEIGAGSKPILERRIRVLEGFKGQWSKLQTFWSSDETKN